LNNSKISDPSGSREIVFSIGTVPARIDSNGNGRADPGEPGYLKLSYQLIVGSGAAPGEYRNIVVAKDVCAACNISNQAEDRVTVTFDPTFDLGTIIGKVFNDKNRDGWQDEGEEGIGSVMVVLDDGTYALTDEYGRYHFPAIKPGHRMLKINLRSLADGAQATTDETVVVSVTAGLLAKANFGVSYTPEAIKIGRPAQPGIRIKSETVHQPIKVMGTVKTLTVLINGTMASLPSQDIRMQVEALDEVVEIEGHKISKPIEFKLEAESPGKVEKWQLSIMDAGGRIIRILEGDGSPPDTVMWDGMTHKKRLVKGGGIYQYQMVFHYTDGSHATSARKVFGVNQTTAISITMTGSAFELGSAKLTPQAKQISKEIADLLRKYSQEKVIIEGHTDSTGSESYNLQLSKKRAQATAAYLVEEEKIPAERILVKWWGESKPLGSNNIEEGRALNRRIEIRGKTYQVDRSKILDQYRMQPAVKINDRPLKVDDHGRFSAALPGEKFKEFSIEVVNKQGQSTSATFSVPYIEISKPEKNLILPFGVSGSGYQVNKRSDTLEGDGQTVVLYYDLLGRTESGNVVEIDGNPVDVETNGTFQVPLALKQGMNPYGILVRNPTGISRIVNLLVTVKDKDKMGQLVIVVEPIPNLLVKLPPRGVPLTNQLLTLSGSTDAGNRVLINAEPVAVEASFYNCGHAAPGQKHP
jgi:outer membrane protein OmpA-like peptidoglycan-associated protein